MHTNIEAARRRVELVKKLNSLRKNFQGIPGNIMTNEEKHYQEYQDFAALRYYLLLTCFDILGQGPKFYRYDEWLNSPETKTERDAIYQKAITAAFEDKLEYVHKEYLKRYGVRHAFMNFIHNVLSNSNREKLYSSLDIKKEVIHIYEEPHTHYQVTSKEFPQELKDKLVSMYKDFIPTTKQKDNFLYQIRNSFTHSGISKASGLNGVIVHWLHDFETLLPTYDTNAQGEHLIYKYHWVDIDYQEKHSYRLTYRVCGWPHVLIEIIEDTINELEEN